MKKKTKDQKWKERLKKDLVKRLLYEDVVVSMSVAKELDEFVDVTVAKEISLAKKEMGKALRKKKKRAEDNYYNKFAQLLDRGEGMKTFYNGYNNAVKEHNQDITDYLEIEK